MSMKRPSELVISHNAWNVQALRVMPGFTVCCYRCYLYGKIIVSCRAGKSPLIFGAKTDREMREWMMAIKLLSEKLTSDRHITTPVSAPATGTEQGVATGRMSQRPQQHLLHASRRDDLTRRSSPQLLTVNSSSWSTGQLHTCTDDYKGKRVKVRGQTLI